MFSPRSQGECGWRKARRAGGGQVCEDPKCKGQYFGVKISYCCTDVFRVQSIFIYLLLVALGELGVACSGYLSQQQDVYSLGSAFSFLMSLFIICVKLTHAHTRAHTLWLGDPSCPTQTPWHSAHQQHNNSKCYLLQETEKRPMLNQK